MGWLTAAAQLFKLIGAVVSLFRETNKEKAEAKKAEVDKLTNAAKETDPKKRASKFNSAVQRINGL